jgi:hypothetical protein
MVKQVCPSSEYSLWKAYFACRWTENDRLAYEFGLLRAQIAGILNDKPVKLEDHMFTSMIPKEEICWEDLTEEEQAQAKEAMKANVSKMFGVK